MVELGGDPWRSSGAVLCSRRASPEQAALDHVQAALKISEEGDATASLVYVLSPTQ